VFLLSYDREVDIPFDVLRLDDYIYLVPHGISIQAETLVRAGVVNISLVNRNVTVGPLEPDETIDNSDAHPLFPVDEFLAVKSVPPILTRFSHKLLQVLGITMEVIYNYYSESNQKILNVEPSQLSIAKGRLLIGEAPSEPMMIVWTGAGFVVVPSSTPLVSQEEAVEEAEGSIAGGKFWCKYGMLDILRR
jgi:hypothetical protein